MSKPFKMKNPYPTKRMGGQMCGDIVIEQL